MSLLSKSLVRTFAFLGPLRRGSRSKKPRILLPQANFHFCKEKKMLRQTFHLMKVLQLQPSLWFLKPHFPELTCNGAVVVSMVVTTDLSTKSLAAVAKKREATAKEAKTMENQTIRPLTVWTLWMCCQPCRLVCWQNSRKLFCLLSRSSGVSILNATIIWTSGGAIGLPLK